MRYLSKNMVHWEKCVKLVINKNYTMRCLRHTVGMQPRNVQTWTVTFHKKMAFITCKLLGPGKGLCRGEDPPVWIANTVSVNILALKFSSLIRSWTVSGRRSTFPDPVVSRLPSKTSVCVVWDSLRKYSRCSSGKPTNNSANIYRRKAVNQPP